MTTEIKENELRDIIEQSIDSSIDRAFKKHSRSRHFVSLLPKLIPILLILALIGGITLHFYNQAQANKPVAPIEGHDLTLSNEGIFGFTVADFEEPILGNATRQKLLIVEEQDIYNNTTITDTGLFNLGIFNKQQALTIHGTGQYTIDLTQIAKEDISLNEQTYELTIHIPHAKLHQVVFDPSKTEIGDSKNGWLAFGEIKLSPDQQKAFESKAVDILTGKLNEAERQEEADRFAKLSAYETFQPLVKAVSPAYKVIIEFKSESD